MCCAKNVYEDPKCSNSLGLAYNVQDHLTYCPTSTLPVQILYRCAPFLGTDCVTISCWYREIGTLPAQFSYKFWVPGLFRQNCTKMVSVHMYGSTCTKTVPVRYRFPCASTKSLHNRYREMGHIGTKSALATCTGTAQVVLVGWDVDFLICAQEHPIALLTQFVLPFGHKK
ncbi:hypothetical protein Fcan01_05117 [Folsomia candida]|uniref:Uncharacterized protein n=1 Tax=Folsomia candida TaxID=158441 RepID=A0A226EPU8_FOLCA|nr:hypothetical protein Fcan01_05117 [Folsomia candida]